MANKRTDAESPRQELSRFADSGGLRDEVAGRLSLEAQDILVDVIRRYCEPRKPSRFKRIRRLTARAKP